MQDHRKLRCTIKILKNKVLPVVLAASLVFGLLTCGASAYVNMGSEITLDDLLDSRNCPSDLRPLIMSNLEQYSDSSEFIILVSCYVSDFVNNFTQFQIIKLTDENGNAIPDLEISFDWNTPTSVELSFNTSLLVYQWRWIYGASNVSYNDGSSYVRSTGFTGNNNQYINSTIYLSPYQGQPSNLYVDYMFDSRVFEVWKSVDYPESSNPLEYINVRVDDSTDLDKISTQKIRFDYIDQDGNNNFKVFTESDFHDIQHVDDCFEFYIFPYLISSYEFTITEATYYPDLAEWGSKTIGLDLTYNEGSIYPLPQDWNSVYTVNQYFQSRSNGTINTGVTLLGLSDSGYFWIDNNRKVCHQVFDVKALFIPYFMNSDLLSINLETLFQLYEQYDVIFTGVQPTQFNTLIPSLDYNDLYVYYSQNGFYPALQKLQEYYVFYQNLDFQHSYSDYTWSLSTDNVGFIVTRSFLLKRGLSALGDIDDRLLEFESNLVGEDSLGSSLQTKLDNILSLEHDFFTDVSNFFQKLEYNMNGFSLGKIEKYLEDIWSATVGERNFNYTDLLPEPLKSIFLYFRGWFISSTQYLQDFIDVSNSSLYGDDLMTLPFEASTVPVLPFEPGTPTPIPIPTFEAGLIEVGGD